MNKETYLKAIPRVLFVLGLVVGLCIGGAGGVIIMQKQAITQGVAHYNGQTGAWMWGSQCDVINISEVIPEMVFKEANQAKLPPRKPKEIK